MFFNKKETQNTKENNWIQLIDPNQINEIIDFSQNKKIIIFKHSTRCSISNMALRIFERNFNFDNQNYKSYFLDLITYRGISNGIAEKFNVIHQSPQVLIIEKGICINNASHEDIENMQLLKS